MRYPSEYEGAVAKAEELFNDWFTINVVDEISPRLPQLADQPKPTRSRESKKLKGKNARRLFTVHESVQTIKASEEVAKTSITATMAEFKDLSNSEISKFYMKPNAENDCTIQKVIQLVNKQE